MEKKLERNQQNKMLAGVAAGLADYLEIDVTIIRILFIIMAVFGFSGLLIYLVLWVVLPEKPFYQNFSSFETDYSGAGWQTSSNSYMNQPLATKEKKSDSGRITAGVLLMAIGAYFMMVELDVIPNWFSIFKLWPLILIAIGFALLFRKEKRKPTLNDIPPIAKEDTEIKSNSSDSPQDQPIV